MELKLQKMDLKMANTFLTSRDFFRSISIIARVDKIRLDKQLERINWAESSSSDFVEKKRERGWSGPKKLNPSSRNKTWTADEPFLNWKLGKNSLRRGKSRYYVTFKSFFV